MQVMPSPDATLVEWVTFVGTVIAAVGGLVGIAVVVFTRVLPWLRERRAYRSLNRGPSAKIYPLKEPSSPSNVSTICSVQMPLGSSPSSAVSRSIG